MVVVHEHPVRRPGRGTGISTVADDAGDQRPGDRDPASQRAGGGIGPLLSPPAADAERAGQRWIYTCVR